MRSAAELTNERRAAIHGRRARAQRFHGTGAADLSGAAQGAGGVGQGDGSGRPIDAADTAPATREKMQNRNLARSLSPWQHRP
jgi:hypothetical protein